uniref:MD-2-related lipid-recognition domain-containing protein n=1 Tax=Biomphalaria glabrata TaxID=6526 RepID=A0A2C9KU99_BIOGL
MKYLTATLGLVSITLVILYQVDTVHSHVRYTVQQAQKDLFDFLMTKSKKTPFEQADVVLEKKVGDSWLKIPCIGFIGSCEYDDVCEFLSLITECPQPFVDAGVPCKCPFQKGVYKLPKTEFDVEIPIFPPGDYHGKANLTHNDQSVACVELFTTFD